MNKKIFRLSPGAPSLVLIVVVLSMSIMGMLMFVRTGSDSKLSARSVQVAQRDAALYARGEETFAALDALVLECRQKAVNDEEYLTLVQEKLTQRGDVDMDDRFISWQEREEGQVLSLSVLLCGYEEPVRLKWHSQAMEAEVGTSWNEF